MTHVLAVGHGKLRLFVLTALLLGGAVACDLLERRRGVEADVKCDTAPAGVSCEVTRRSGTAAAQVCWDMEFACVNGRVVTGHACRAVPVGRESLSTNAMPWSAFANAAQCDQISTMRIANVVVQVTS
jgi:hypothetical protein